jgi:hypothetical protein
MRNENSESAEVTLLLEGRHLEFIESQRRQQPKIPPRIEIIRQLIEKAIDSASSEGRSHRKPGRAGFARPGS